MDYCTEERFLKDVKEHEMHVERDDGVNRHIQFKRPGTGCYHFELITWPEHLCVTGDCGTYVFNRITDMFEFFRTEQRYKESHPELTLFINSGYWGEKLLSISQPGGYKEFDEEAFRARVGQYFDAWIESAGEGDAEWPDHLKEEIDTHVLSEIDNGEHAAYAAVYSFEHDGLQFDDFFDSGGCEKHTFHYIWCLYAIAWGIEQYDAAAKS